MQNTAMMRLGTRRAVLAVSLCVCRVGNIFRRFFIKSCCLLENLGCTLVGGLRPFRSRCLLYIFGSVFVGSGFGPCSSCSTLNMLTSGRPDFNVRIHTNFVIRTNFVTCASPGVVFALQHLRRGRHRRRARLPTVLLAIDVPPDLDSERVVRGDGVPLVRALPLRVRAEPRVRRLPLELRDRRRRALPGGRVEPVPVRRARVQEPGEPGW
jgi:hypothetical protein